MRTEPERALLSAGRNCWRLERADRVALLIGAPAYFDVLRQSLLGARASVRIVGWHLDASTELGLPDGGQSPAEQSYPAALAALLQAVAEREPRFRGFVLDWDYSMLYDVDRDLRPALREPWKGHRRIHFGLDGTQAVGAAHHEKIVAVDDALAFVGSIDPCPPGSGTAAKAEAAPALQVLLDGPAAAALAEQVRRRWRHVVGREPRFVPGGAGAPANWPSRAPVHFASVEVAIARSVAPERGKPAVTEVRQLLLDAVAAARRRLYIETSNLSSADVADALAASLQQDDGPEIVVVMQRDCDGWLEPVEQLGRRCAVLRRLQASDAKGRLRAVTPVRVDPAKGHSRAIGVSGLAVVVDERLLITGSATLSNRSLALDTECCVAIEARGASAEATSAAIAECRDRLLAGHLGIEPAALAQALADGASLCRVIDQPSDTARRLEPLTQAAPGPGAGSIGAEANRDQPGDAVLDASPERPVAVDALSALLRGGKGGASSSRGRLLGIGALVVLVLAATGAWRWTPLSEMVDADRLADMARKVSDTPLAPLWVLGAYLAGSLVALPITLLIVATSLVFSTGWALLYALAGSLAGAALNFVIGRAVGSGLVSRIGGDRWNRLNQRLSQSGVLAVFALRILPIAPFTVVNLAAGASQLSFRDFMIGSLLGLAPGVVTITAFSGLVTRLLRDPSPQAIALMVVGGTVLSAAAWGLQRWVGARGSRPR